jgi:hypothetical protein
VPSASRTTFGVDWSAGFCTEVDTVPRTVSLCPWTLTFCSVKLPAGNVAIASEKVAVMLGFVRETFVALLSGVLDRTVGAVASDTLQVRLGRSGLNVALIIRCLHLKGMASHRQSRVGYP